MGVPKITGFIIGVLIVSFFAAVLGIFIADLNNNYNTVDSSGNLTTYNKLVELSNITEEIKEETNINEKTGITDIIGGYFSSGYQALRVTAKSFDTFDTMRQDSFKEMGLGAIGTHLQILIGAIIIVLIFIGVFIAAIVKRDL